MDVGIMIGHEKGSVTLSEAATAILNIIESAPDREVAIAALTALREVSSINGTTISNCTVGSMPPPRPLFDGE